MHRLVHDVAAETDLINIWVYTHKEWGIEQAERYLDFLEYGINKIAKTPEDGHPRDELRRGYWSVRIEHHVIFYTFTDSEIRIRRVLHEVMDSSRHL